VKFKERASTVADEPLRHAASVMLIVLYTKMDVQRDKMVTVVGRMKLTALAKIF